MSAERRRFPRFPFHSQGALRLAGEEHRGTLLDVSLQGALFCPDGPVAPTAGSQGELEIFHAGQPGFCSARARVVYHRDNLVGLGFEALSEGAQQLLAQVMTMNLAQDALLTRPLPEMLGAVGERGASSEG